MPSVSTGLPVTPPVTTEGMASQASQNLFEHMAQIAQGTAQGASPAQLGAGVMQNLNGFLDRVHRFADRASALPSLSNPINASHMGALQPPGAANAAGKSTSAPLDSVIKSLSLMFDHSIETQLVVRGATQVSGAANTLLKGQ